MKYLIASFLLLFSTSVTLKSEENKINFKCNTNSNILFQSPPITCLNISTIDNVHIPFY